MSKLEKEVKMIAKDKCNEIIDFLNDRVFIRLLRYAEKHNDKTIYNFVINTINEMYSINSVDRLVSYYKNIIKCQTPKLKYVSNYLKSRKLIRLEDIEKEFNEKFNKKWLKK